MIGKNALDLEMTLNSFCYEWRAKNTIAHVQIWDKLNSSQNAFHSIFCVSPAFSTEGGISIPSPSNILWRISAQHHLAWEIKRNCQ